MHALWHTIGNVMPGALDLLTTCLARAHCHWLAVTRRDLDWNLHRPDVLLLGMYDSVMFKYAWRTILVV